MTYAEALNDIGIAFAIAFTLAVIFWAAYRQ